MPRKQPTQSWQFVRNYCELFQWRDKRTGLMTTGYNPPAGVQDLSRVPFFIKYVTGKGKFEQGTAICLKVDRRKHLRMIQFIPKTTIPTQTASIPSRRSNNAIRYVRDYLIIEINGTRIITN